MAINGNPNGAEHLDGSNQGEIPERTCPKCGIGYKQIALHIPACNGDTDE
jgi:hypothetical protein